MRHPDLKERSTNWLIDELWNAVIPAWIGASLGACMILGAAFWRFMIRPWHLVIEYSDGHAVWGTRRTGDRLFEGPIPPDIPIQDNLFPLCVVIIGGAIIYVSTLKWRTIAAELRYRRTEAGK